MIAPRQALLLIAAALLGACTGAPPRETAPPPAWLQTLPDETTYLYGRGAGDSLAQAQQRARAEIARIFETRVQDWRWEHTHARTGSNAAPTTQLSRSLASETARVIHGSEIAALWRDPKEGTHYALARLPRSTAANQVRAHLNAIAARAAELDAETHRARDPLQHLNLLAQGRAAEAQLIPLRRDLAILAREDAASYPASPWRFEPRLREALGALTVTLQSEPAALAPALAGAARALGLDDTADAPFTVRAQLLKEPPLREQGWHWQRAQLSLSLHAREAPLRGLQWPLKQAGATPLLARQRVLAEASALLQAHLETLLLGEFAEGPKNARELPSAR